MGAIKKKNNRSDYHSALDMMSRQPALSQSSSAVAMDMLGPIQRIRMATEIAKKRLESGRSPADILDSLKKLSDECEVCRVILFRAFNNL